MPVTVNHQSVELNWTTPTQIENPKTLVLGSFNPFLDNSNSVDYYYGRKSNHFWRTLAILIGECEEYFFDYNEKLNRKIALMNNRFYCLDVINSIDFTSDSDDQLNKYLANKIFSNFLDQNIWVSKTNFEKQGNVH